MNEQKCAVSGETCRYWRRISGAGVDQNHCCHYLLDEGHSRKKGKNGKCLSRIEPEEDRQKRPWDMPDPPDETILCGYKRNRRDV